MRSDLCGMVSLLTPFIDVRKQIEKLLSKFLPRGLLADCEPQTTFGIDIPATLFVLFSSHLHPPGCLLPD